MRARSSGGRHVVCPTLARRAPSARRAGAPAHRREWRCERPRATVAHRVPGGPRLGPSGLACAPVIGQEAAAPHAFCTGERGSCQASSGSGSDGADAWTAGPCRPVRAGAVAARDRQLGRRAHGHRLRHRLGGCGRPGGDASDAGRDYRPTGRGAGLRRVAPCRTRPCCGGRAPLAARLAGRRGARGPPAHGAGANTRAASAGSSRLSDWASPCAGTGWDATSPRLPTPLPPYACASVLRHSRHRPAVGTPIR